jgi:hypothetical protein
MVNLPKESHRLTSVQGVNSAAYFLKLQDFRTQR